MSSHNTVLKRYIQNVSAELPCTGRAKRHIITQLQDSVSVYLEQNPDADFMSVQAHFGSPQEIATGYVEAQDAPSLLSKMRAKKKIIAIVSGIMAVILLIWIGAVAWAAKNQKESNNDYEQERIEIIE